LSIGTGTGLVAAIDETNPNNYKNDISKLSLYFDFSYKIETAAANEILNAKLGGNFSRLETYTTAPGNAYESKWWPIFKEEGQDMWNKPIDEPKERSRKLI